MTGSDAQRLLGFEQSALQIQDSFAGQHTGLEFRGVKRLNQVIVSAGLHRVEKITFSILRREENGIYVLLRVEIRSDSTADLDAIHPRKNPIQQGEGGHV